MRDRIGRIAFPAVFVLFRSSSRYSSEVGFHALDVVSAVWVECIELPRSVVVWRLVLAHLDVAYLACPLVNDSEEVGFFRTLWLDFRLL